MASRDSVIHLRIDAEHKTFEIFRNLWYNKINKLHEVNTLIDITSFLNTFIKALDNTFGERAVFIGLQGSYGRGEATETSDIDLVVILDKLTPADIEAYSLMLDTLPHRELICGFLSGKSELLSWEPSDLFQLYFDTEPIRGDLVDLLGLLDRNAVNRAIKIGACNVYHGIVHNMLYGKSSDILKAFYKSAVFTVQAIHYFQTGRYIRRHAELSSAVSPDEKKIVDTYILLKRGGAVNFREMSETLFYWAKKWIEETK